MGYSLVSYWISDEKFFNWIVNRLISTKIYSFDT